MVGSLLVSESRICGHTKPVPGNGLNIVPIAQNQLLSGGVLSWLYLLISMLLARGPESNGYSTLPHSLMHWKRLS